MGDGGKERAMNCLSTCLLRCSPSRAVIAYVTEAVLWVISCHASRELVVLERRDATSTSLLPPYSFPLTLLRFLLRMARLALFSVVLFSLYLSAIASSSQQPLAYPDGSVHTTDGWSWIDCGQSCIAFTSLTT